MKHDGCPSKNEIGIFKGKKNQGFFFFFLICGLETISRHKETGYRISKFYNNTF